MKDVSRRKISVKTYRNQKPEDQLGESWLEMWKDWKGIWGGMKKNETWQELEVSWGSRDCRGKWLNDAEGENDVTLS